MVRAKYVVFTFIGVMTAYVLYHNERFLVQPDNPVWQHYASIAWMLLPHGVAGACALVMAPFQFSERLRKKYTKFHRIGGRVYVAGILVLAPFGAYMQYYEESLGLPRSFTIASTVDASLLYITTGIALLFAVKRKITQHRQWMTRSYAVALVFFEGRFILGVTGLETMGLAVTETVVWTLLAFSILLADVANNWQELKTALVPAKPAARARSTAVVYDVEPA